MHGEEEFCAEAMFFLKSEEEIVKLKSTLSFKFKEEFDYLTDLALKLLALQSLRKIFLPSSSIPGARKTATWQEQGRVEAH